RSQSPGHRPRHHRSFYFSFWPSRPELHWCARGASSRGCPPSRASPALSWLSILQVTVVGKKRHVGCDGPGRIRKRAYPKGIALMELADKHRQTFSLSQFTHVRRATPASFPARRSPPPADTPRPAQDKSPPPE